MRIVSPDDSECAKSSSESYLYSERPPEEPVKELCWSSYELEGIEDRLIARTSIEEAEAFVKHVGRDTVLGFTELKKRWKFFTELYNA